MAIFMVNSTKNLEKWRDTQCANLGFLYQSEANSSTNNTAVVKSSKYTSNAI